jgi:endothelin-converting enzyme
LEPECIHAASEILYNLDPHYEDIDPCDDFEQYACGGWRDRHDMRPDQGSIFAGTIMAENAQVQLRHILEAPDTSEGDKLSSADKKSFQKLKSAYDSCTDTETLKKRGSKPLNDLLDQIETIYPVHGKCSKTNLSDAVAFLIQSGVSALTELSVSVRNS